VITPASTVSDNNTCNSRVVIVNDHTNSGIHSGFMLFGFVLIIVVIKIAVPRMGDTPTKCREKIARSME
jgi:hypothetical protein